MIADDCWPLDFNFLQPCIHTPSNKAAKEVRDVEKILRMPTRRSKMIAVQWKNHENEKHDDDSENKKSYEATSSDEKLSSSQFSNVNRNL